MSPRVLALTFVLAAILVGSSVATIGVDISQPVYQEVGSCDHHGVQSIKNARSAGIPYVDGYIYPDVRQNAKTQINSMLSCLRNAGAHFGMIWLDIEGVWPANHANNRAFIGELSEALKAAGVNHGVYTSESQWSTITGNWNGLSHLPLWYPHWDGSESFHDFKPFGGWTKPAIKQYRGNGALCGVGVDMDWY